MNKCVSRIEDTFSSRPLWTLPVAAAAFAFSTAVYSQIDSPESDEVFELDAFEVGITASMIKAQEIKKDGAQVMDSIVAEDINKLPDLSVTEALQRISGIQVSRDLGEGANVSLRGLTDVTSTVNGQEVFSPQIVTGESRVMNLQTIPSDMIREINVLKSPTADMIEGGIAGTIDIRLRRPLDFDGDPHGSFQVRYAEGELAGDDRMQYSGMLTDTWEVGSEGKVGALFSYSLQDRVGRQDMNQTTAPKGYNVGTVDEFVGLGGSYEPLFIIDRKREGILASVGYAPNDRLSLFVEYNESKQTSKQETHGVQFETPTATAIDMIPSGETITYTRNDETVTVPIADAFTATNGSVISFAAYRYWLEETSQLSAGGTWRGENITVEAEIGHTETYTDFFYNGIHPKTDAGHAFRYDATTKVPQVYSVNPDVLTTYSNFTEYLYSWTAWREHHGDATTASVDVTQELSNEFFDRLKYGVRYNKRSSGQDEYGGLYNFGWPSPDEIVAPGDNPNMLVPNTYSAFFDGAPGKTNNYLYPNLDILRAPDVDQSWYQLATELGSSNPDTTETPQDQVWEIEEETKAAYAMANFGNSEGSAFRFDGNIGARFIETDVTSNGYKRVSGGAWESFTETGSYTDFLPSLNTRFHLPGDDFYLRVSLSKQLSRHSLSSLNSRLTLTPVAGIDDYDWTGRTGNPNLEPLRTDAVDLSLEKYFNASTSVYLSYYDKKIDGYKQNQDNIEIIDGETVLVSRPYNVDDASVSGFEFGYQQFFTFLPEPFRGLGVNANATYVDAVDPSGNPLQNLSKKSYNLILMYEKDRFSSRIAYNWRDAFTRSTTSGGALGGSVPLVDEAFGWMDATVGYDITDALRVQLDVTNVLQAHRQSFYDGNPLFDHEDVLEDRMWYLSLNYKL